MADVVNCPTAQEWQGLAQGACSGAETERLRRHLEQCPRCAGEFARLSALPVRQTIESATAALDLSTPQTSEPTSAGLSDSDVISDQTMALLRYGEVEEESEGLEHSTVNLTFEAAEPAAEPPADPGSGGDAAKYLRLPQGAGEIGRLGPYRVLKVIGLRGLGIVFQAEDPHLKRQVALKALRPSMAVSPEARERFIREAQLTAKLEHDHIVSIHEAGEDRGVLFLAMELLQGESLEQRLKREKRLPIAEVVRIGREIAEGLAAAHDHGLIHQDLRPATIWLESTRDRVKILDFGLAHAVGRDAQPGPTRSLHGDAPYLAPEQVEGQKVDFRADLFSLGGVLYHVATGQPPDVRASGAGLDPRSQRPDLPPALAEAIVRLLAVDPAQRPRSTRAVVQAFEYIANPDQAGRGPVAAGVAATGTSGGDELKEHVTAIVEAPKWKARAQFPWRAAALAAGLFMIVAAVIFLSWPAQEDERDKDRFMAEPRPIDHLRRENIPPEALAAAGRGKAANVDPDVVAIFGYGQIRDPLRVLVSGDKVGPVRDLAFSPDGKYLATGGWELQSGRGELKLWDSTTGQLLRALAGHDSAISCVAFSPDSKLLAAAAGDHLVKVWSVATGEIDLELVWHTKAVNSVVFSKDGTLIATGSSDTSVRVWSAITGKEERLLEDHVGDVADVAFHPSQKYVASGGADRSVRIWDLAEKKVAKALEGHKKPVTAVAFSPDGQWLVSADLDGVLKVWAVSDGREVTSVRAHQGVIHSVAFSPDGALLATTGPSNAIVKIWRTDTWHEMLVLKGHTGVVHRAVFSHDGRQLASAGEDRTVAIWDPWPSAAARSFPGHTGPILAVAVSPDDKHLASGGRDGTVKLWDIAGGRVTQTLQGHIGPVRALVFSPDGGLLASGGDDALINLWNLAGGDAARRLKGHRGPVSGLAFRKDGKHLASASADRTIKIWDIDSGRDLPPLSGNKDSLTAVAYSPSGETLVSGGADSLVKLWDPVGGGVLASFPGHGQAVSTVAFAPDGRLLASGGVDRSVRLWDVATGKEHSVLPGHNAPVTSVAFRPGGTWLASASEDGSVRLWPTAGQAPPRRVYPLLPPGIPVHALAFSTEGRHLITANDDGTLCVLRLVVVPTAE